MKWYRVIVTFIFLIFLFAFIFWLGNGIQGADSFNSNLYASALTALTPGFGDFKPANSNYQLVAAIEAILGAFLWSVSIVIFAGKFIK